MIGPDGQEYGPASVDTLKQWVSENRLGPQSQLRSFSTGQLVLASSVPGLFAATTPPPVAAPVQPAPVPGDWSQPASYASAATRPVTIGDDGKGEVWGAIIRSVIALVLFFVFHGLGLIVGAYAVFYGYQALQSGHKYGIVAMVISCVAMAVIVIGWLLRLQGA